jgi:fructose-1,6-bisphosphatase/inositol monophosphatase family enzyme
VYHARAGGGAWFDDQPVRVSKATDERGQIMALPAGYLRAFRFRRAGKDVPRPARALPDPRTTGSCTAELVLIASGALRAGVFIKPSIWDVAAGALIVREAGGEVLTWKDGRWQRFERFEPEQPAKGQGPATLRNWGRPLLMGAPEAIDRLTARMAWHPKLPRPLQKLIGLQG